MRDVKMVVVLCVLFFSAVCFNGKLEAGTEDLHERVQMMEDEINALKAALKGQQTQKKEVFVREQDNARDKKIDKMLKSYEASKKTGAEDLHKFYFSERVQDMEDKGLSGFFGDTRTKPFLKNIGKNTYLGGYMDIELRAGEASANSLRDTPNPPASDRSGLNTFRQFRFIPFIYSDVSERIKLAAELEFEFEGVGGGRQGEVIIEFATIDFLIKDWINFRGGVILAPLGKLNLVHDTPLQDFVDRPMVNQMIVPTTLSETGMGFFGEFYPTALSKLSYEAYIVNGFNGLTVANDGTGRRNFSRAAGLAGGNGGFRENQNNSFDFVGRLAYSPFLGLELGASVHTGKYDERNDNRLTIAVFDWTFQKGPFEFVGEIARDYIERDTFARLAGLTEDMWGYYAEVRYHFMPEILKNWAPTFFTEQSTFTAVIRHGHVQTVTADRETNFANIARGVNTNPELFFLRDRVTLGLNFRITEDTVFKLDYQINTEHKDLQSASNNELLFQISTYF